MKQTATEIHSILLHEAIRQWMPRYFVDDLLVHDLNKIKELVKRSEETGEDVRFYWFLRPSGTHLLECDLHNLRLHEPLRCYRFIDGELKFIRREE
jgi:hypothetical protein